MSFRAKPETKEPLPRFAPHGYKSPTYNVQTIDGNGMRDALDKYTDVLQRHFENAVRKMNRG